MPPTWNNGQNRITIGKADDLAIIEGDPIFGLAHEGHLNERVRINPSFTTPVQLQLTVNDTIVKSYSSYDNLS